MPSRISDEAKERINEVIEILRYALIDHPDNLHKHTVKAKDKMALANFAQAEEYVREKRVAREMMERARAYRKTLEDLRVGG